MEEKAWRKKKKLLLKEPEETIVKRIKLRRQEAGDEDLSDMSTLQGDEEEVKEQKGLETLTPKNC